MPGRALKPAVHSALPWWAAHSPSKPVRWPVSEKNPPIESGLEPGRQVIVEGVQLVRQGMKVKAEPAPAPAAPPAPGTKAAGAAGAGPKS